jgi:hypothetical protein
VKRVLAWAGLTAAIAVGVGTGALDRIHPGVPLAIFLLALVYHDIAQDRPFVLSATYTALTSIRGRLSRFTRDVAFPGLALMAMGVAAGLAFEHSPMAAMLFLISVVLADRVAGYALTRWTRRHIAAARRAAIARTSRPDAAMLDTDARTEPEDD